MPVSLRKAQQVHIHQGGTTNTYCGQPLRLDAQVTNVSWEQAAQSNCDDCLGVYISGLATPPPWCGCPACS